MRDVGNVMRSKNINGVITDTRIDMLTVDGVNTRYEVVSRMTINNPNDNRSINVICYVGLDYNGVALIINGSKRGDMQFTNAIDAYATFATLANQYGVEYVVYDGLFANLMRSVITGDA
jgi:hypothetical protein